jgi:5-oxopent-3-ene-1,2,5-tricarboxylate decarboxylase/2-hydroxyhepta-2,4-diene-1,7-dioate isomerase
MTEVQIRNVNLRRDIRGKAGETASISRNSIEIGTVYGTLLNYHGTLAALGDAVNEAPYKAPPKAPVLYIKPVNTVSGHHSPIPVPDGTDQLEVGAALGLVIGKVATRVKEKDALDYVAGFTIVNDVSIPHTSFYRPAISQKSRDGFCPIGPYIVEREAIDNADALTVKVLVNGEVRQENTTANLVRSVARLLEDVTDFMTLHPGDILLVGVPENPPLAKVGDLVRIEIDGIGYLENTLVNESDIDGGVSR